MTSNHREKWRTLKNLIQVDQTVELTPDLFISWSEIYCSLWINLGSSTCPKVRAWSWVHRLMPQILQGQRDRSHQTRETQMPRDKAAVEKKIRAPAGVGETWWVRQFSDLVQTCSLASCVAGINPSTAGLGLLDGSPQLEAPGQVSEQSSDTAAAFPKWILSWVGVGSH